MVLLFTSVVTNTFYQCSPDTFIKLRNLLYQLKHLSVCVKLFKVPSHSGIFGNEMADQKVKELAFGIFKGHIAAPTTVCDY